MTFIDRFRELKTRFSYERTVKIDDASLEIRPFRFRQELITPEIKRLQQAISPPEFCPVTDDVVEENNAFTYPVFVPKGVVRTGKAIILLHGLNERRWEKYLPWAEDLALKTGRAVVLFPIAFHMNRTPGNWHNPRMLLPYVDRRKETLDSPHNTTFANVALSCRLSAHPVRFYISGKESLFNLWQLIEEIKNGRHPLFNENTSINLFAYSIGALLAQVLLLSNPGRLTSDSRLFLFCGGTLFSRMDGNSRDIMDRESFHTLKNYLLHDFLDKERRVLGRDDDFLEKAFKAMLAADQYRPYRETFFRENQHRVAAITLKNDTVIPTAGVEEAFGQTEAVRIVEERDFPYDYSHQTPFPVHNRVAPETVQQCFSSVFDRAAAFLA